MLQFSVNKLIILTLTVIVPVTCERLPIITFREGDVYDTTTFK